MRKLIYSIPMLVLLFIAACNSSEKPAEIATDSLSIQSSAEGYTCSMHPEIRSDMPGTCSICNMDLVKDSNIESDNMMIDSMMPDSSSSDHNH
jgi:hypothetical protein